MSVSESTDPVEHVIAVVVGGKFGTVLEDNYTCVSQAYRSVIKRQSVNSPPCSTSTK